MRLLLNAAECRRKVRRLCKPPFIPGRLPTGPIDEPSEARLRTYGGNKANNEGPLLPDASSKPAESADETNVDDQALGWTAAARSDLAAWFGPTVTKKIKHSFRWKPDIKPCKLQLASFRNCC